MFSLETPEIDEDGMACVQFEYHMYGDDIGELIVYMESRGENSPFFERSGDRGEEWLHSKADVDMRRNDKVLAFCVCLQNWYND